MTNLIFGENTTYKWLNKWLTSTFEPKIRRGPPTPPIWCRIFLCKIVFFLHLKKNSWQSSDIRRPRGSRRIFDSQGGSPRIFDVYEQVPSQQLTYLRFITTLFAFNTTTVNCRRTSDDSSVIYTKNGTNAKNNPTFLL